MGFALQGGTGHGISAVSGRKNLIIRGGIVAGWAASGVYLSGTTNTVINCAVMRQDHRELHFYHYAEFYLTNPSKPFRTICPADFYIVVGSCNE